ncbi:MAG TPA: carboxypeptidase-like regulatory domain-containing protein [Terracidiphilus sp.]|nr:carboxypeptidase-like regulatory domain-containing protein [Terracidiphilus sp.]
MRNFIGRLTVVALLALFATFTHAQNLASITGTVTDSSGAVIAGASVTLENASTGVVAFKTLTNAQGSYTIANVAPGPGYKITFSANGFKSVVITGIYLNVTTTRTQNAKLDVGSEAQSVEVSASAENVTLNTTDATVGNNFQVAELNDLPVANRDNPSALFYQQPGVTLSGAVTGARTDQSNVTVDGLEVNDNATGQFGDIIANAPVDSVQEFRGVTADPLSSSGQGGGGQFELVTKSGTNQFHGALVEYHRDTDLQANNWFNNNSGTPRPPLIRNQFGGNIGGPIWRDKAFFFFDWNSRKDTVSNLVDRTVPIGTNTSGYRGGQLSYVTDEGDVNTLTNTQLAALDPNGIGWNQAELALFQKRYPQANDFSGAVGDLVNTAGYRFNAPVPLTENDYVEKIDYTLNDHMKLWGVGHVARESATESAIQFPGDPTTAPLYDHSYSWAVGHTWTIGSNKLNQAEFGETFEDFDFHIIYNPQGANQYTFGGLSGPYAGGNNSQARTYPIPVVRDDFSWQKGNHNYTFGGTFKWDTPDEFAAEDYNFPTVGLDTNAGFPGLSNGQRPSDIDGDYIDIYDSAYATALGVVPAVNSNFNYNNKGAVLPQGTGLDLKYRYYETEVYFGDTWKIRPNFTISYGVRYQNYTVPYEMRGEEAITNLNLNGTTSTFDWDKYWNDRLKQSAAGDDNPATLPFLQFIYGGKVNHQPGYFHPSNKNFAPRVAFAWSPGSDSKTVIRGGGGVIYDHSLINALQFQQLQTSYVFESSNTNIFASSGDATGTLESSPRFAGLSNPPQPPAAPAIVTPFIPFVDFSEGPYPYGLGYGEFNLMMDTKLKTPYSIQFNLGFQHEFPQGYILKMDYVGRLGRRLLAVADSSQLLDFPDNTGGSTQTMGQAFGAVTTQLRQNKAAGQSAYGAILNLSPQPWFEDMAAGINDLINYYDGTSFTTATQAIAYGFYPLPQRGDFSDTIQGIASTGYLGPNVGMASQFASNSVWTNKGSSNYHGLLVTLHKNVGYGLRFDLNYTWSHSLDNVSLIANSIAASNGFGFICDVQRPRECRANSDFDVAAELNGNFIYDLPFGRGRTIGATMPFWLNEAVGGWTISGLPTWHAGLPYNATANAYITSFANNAPATLIGQTGALKPKLHGGRGQRLQAFASGPAALAAFQGPTGFDIGSRNNLRGPQYFDIDLGLAKTFPIWGERTWLKFRCDAFNALNHPNFSNPNVDITQASGVPFGTITSMNGSARVLQGALRLEF